MVMGRGCYAKLDRWKEREADKAAAARTAYGRAHRRSWIAEEIREAEDILGCRCERAGKVFFPWLEWHSYREGPVDDLADLGDLIDVKGVRLDRHELLVKVSRIKEGWAYLLVSAENAPFYWIAGWRWGWELKELGVMKHSRPRCYAWPWELGDLRPVRELQAITRGTAG